MMKDKTKLKGTVLFTVVSVLMVLIVFLMGTLALAATASNRAYGNYQKEQTEVTARAVLDSVVQAINEDNGASGGIKAQMANLVTVGSSMDVRVQGTDGLEADVTITNKENRSVYSVDQEKWVNGTIYEVSTTIDKTMAGTTYCAYIVDEKIANVVSQSSGGGAFVSLGGIDGKIGTSGFTAGGTEINLDGSENDSFDIDNSAVQMAPFYLNGNLTVRSQCSAYFNKLGGNQFYAVTGNWHMTAGNFSFEFGDDFVWDKDTPVAYNEIPCMYIGKTMTTDVDVTLGSSDDDTNGDGKPDGVPVNLYVGRINYNNGAGLNVHGDTYVFGEDAISEFSGSSKDSTLYQWAYKTITGADGTQKKNNFGNYYSNGSIVIGLQGKKFEAQGDMRIADHMVLKNDQNNNVTVSGDVVVGGTLVVEQSATLNCKDLYVDVLVCDGTINATNIKANKIYGAGTLNATNVEGEKAADTYAFSLASSSVTKEWYSDFNVTWTQTATRPNDWSADVYTYSYTATKNISQTINGVETVTTEPVSGGPIQVELFTWSNPNTIEAYLDADSNLQKLKSTDVTETTDSFSYGYSGVPYGITLVGATDAVTGVGTQVGKSVEEKYGQKIYPEAYIQTNILSKIVVAPTARQYMNYPTNLTKLNATLPVLDASDNLALNSYTSYDVVDNANPTNNVNYGSQEDPITQSCILDSEPEGDLYITATTPIVLYVKNGFSMQSGKDIIIDDGAAVYFYLEGSMSMHGGDIITKAYKDFFASTPAATPEIQEVQASAGEPFYPNVFIFSGSGASLTMSNDYLVTAHIRAPFLKFTQAKGDMLPFAITYAQKDTNNNTVKVTYEQNDYVGVIGQLICGEIDVGNDWGLIYVTLGGSAGTSCGCCATCSNGSGCTCTCPGCSCNGSSTPTSSMPQKFTPLYYNYY